jgi:hypothetical protein
MLPAAREEDLLVKEVMDETLVYDLKSHKAHCLNPAAALIWRHCDGKTSVPALAELVHEKLSILADEALIWAALLRLDKARLLRERVVPPKSQDRLSRRDLGRKLVTAGVAAMVVSVVVPTPAAAASNSCGHSFGANCGCPAGFTCFKPLSTCVCLRSNTGGTHCPQC